MRTSQASLLTTLLASLLSSAGAASFDCENVLVDKHSYDFSKLGGQHTLHWIRDEPPSISDYAFRLDICANLPKKSGVPNDEQCPTGTRSRCRTTEKLADGDAW